MGDKGPLVGGGPTQAGEPFQPSGTGGLWTEVWSCWTRLYDVVRRTASSQSRRELLVASAHRPLATRYPRQGRASLPTLRGTPGLDLLCAR